MKSEEWRQLERFPWYEVSSLGRVRRIKTGRIMKPTLDDKGYLRVGLRRDGKQYISTVHTVVAEAFVGLRPEGMQINHIDGVKTNNCPSNLEFVTCRENLRHAYRTGLNNQRGEANNQARLKEGDVRQIRAMAALRVPRSTIAKEFGIALSYVDTIVAHRKWAHVA